MIQSLLVVLSRAVDGRDDELNDWYTNIHLRDVLKFRGCFAAQRFAATDDPPGPLPAQWPWRYLALYECYDAQRFTQEHRDAADTVRMEITGAFDASIINDFYYDPLVWRANTAQGTHGGGAIVEFVNARPGAEAQLRAFYEERIHTAGRRPGVRAAAFLAFRPQGQMLPYGPAHDHVAVYWTDDDGAAAAAWRADDTLAACPYLDPETLAVAAWRRLTRRFTQDDVTHTSAADLAAEEAARATLRRPEKGAGTRAALGLAQG